MPFIPAIEGLRGVTFLLIFAAHASQFVNAPFQLSGKEGLFLFFVLSAYLVTKNLTASFTKHNNKPHVLLNYFIRRILRIYPMYTLSMLILPSIILFHHPLLTILRHLLLIEGREHLWAVPVELKYYILLPIVACLFSVLAKKGMRFLVGAVVLFLVGYGFLYERIASTVAVHNLVNDLSIWLYLPAFIIGSWASFWPYNKHVFRHKNILFILLAVLFCVSIPLSNSVFVEKDAYTAFYYLLMTSYSLIWAVCIYFVTVIPNIFHSFFENNVLRFIGKISFSAYLWHYSLFLWMEIASYYGFTLSGPIKIGVVLAATLFLSAITYRYIEQPFLSFRLLPKKS
jgi:peptidoglycan/LPS O-acetylase OafA/YrhL